MRVQRIKEAIYSDSKNQSGWRLCFQRCRYVYDDGEIQEGYRFIWRRPKGGLQPARGQARIPSIKVLEALVQKAKEEGWGEYEDQV